MKPELCEDEALGTVSRDARLMFVLLITQADDQGRLRASPRLLRSRIYPYDDDVTAGMVEGWLEELQGAGVVRRYSVDGQHYADMPGWSRHQRVDHPSPSQLPAFDDQAVSAPSSPGFARIREDSRGFAPDMDQELESLPTVETPVPFSNGTGRARQEFAGKPEPDPPPPARPGAQGGADHELSQVANGKPDSGVRPPPAPPEVEQVFAAYCASTDRNGGYRLDPKRRRLIARALKLYPLDDVLDAMQGWRHIAHNRGENDRRTVYNELDLLLRDAAHIERFRDAARSAQPDLEPVRVLEFDPERIRALRP